LVPPPPPSRRIREMQKEALFLSLCLSHTQTHTHTHTPQGEAIEFGSCKKEATLGSIVNQEKERRPMEVSIKVQVNPELLKRQLDSLLI